MKSVRTTYYFLEGALVLLLFFAASATAQNLIPNPGFEEYDGDSVLYWEQPHGTFYHFESRLNRKGSEVHINRVNGICLLNKMPSEFLQIGLVATLKEGKKYNVSFEAIAMFKDKPSLDGIRTVDWRFLEYPINVITRFTHADIPDICFDVMDLAVNNNWKKFTAVYTARGNENVLLVGKIRDLRKTGTDIAYDSVYHIRDSLYNIFYKEKYRQQMAATEALMNIKDQEKAMKMMDKTVLKLEKIYLKSKDSISRIYTPTIDSLYRGRKDVSSPSEDVRFYFDNFSIVPIDGVEDAAIVKEDEMPFELDQTYKFSNVNFDTDKDVLKEESFAELDFLGEILIKYDAYHVHLTGHTDNTNLNAYNQILSENRAAACKAYLVSKGIDETRISTEGKGETDPIVSNDTEEGKAMNRRVEFRITKKE